MIIPGQFISVATFPGVISARGGHFLLPRLHSIPVLDVYNLPDQPIQRFTLCTSRSTVRDGLLDLARSVCRKLAAVHARLLSRLHAGSRVQRFSPAAHMSLLLAEHVYQHAHVPFSIGGVATYWPSERGRVIVRPSGDPRLTTRVVHL